MRRKLPLLLLARGWDNSSQLRDGVSMSNHNRYLAGLDSPMFYGLSKYPIREGRRIIGRPAGVNLKALLSGNRYLADYNDDYYRQTLLPEIYRRLKTVLAGLKQQR